MESYRTLLQQPRPLVSLFLAVWIHSLVICVHCARNASRWQTLSGNPPIAIARGGFSGCFPDSSQYAYDLAVRTSLSNIQLWCDLQLTKDGHGICAPEIILNNCTNIDLIYPTRNWSSSVNGKVLDGWFSINFTSRELSKVTLFQAILSRTDQFDGVFGLQSVQEVNTFKSNSLWLNVQHDAFFSQHNLSVSRFILSLQKAKVIPSYISSPEVGFLRQVKRQIQKDRTKLVFRFLGRTEREQTSNLSYSSLLKNLAFIKTFASGILVPKDYIYPMTLDLYLQPSTTLVSDAHRAGLEVFVSGFANDVVLAYNYSYDPSLEYLNFVANPMFSVDGVLSDFPITPSTAIDCFALTKKNAPPQVNLLVMSLHGASGIYPSCTDLAYKKAIEDRVDVIDCPVQMSKDKVLFCLTSPDLSESTAIFQSRFSVHQSIILAIKDGYGIYSFNLTWAEIQTLTPQISEPFLQNYSLHRNPRSKNAGRILSLQDFLSLAQNTTSLYGLKLSIEYADVYMANGFPLIDSVFKALDNSSFHNQTAKKVMIQSSDSSVLKEIKNKNYERVYKIRETIDGVLNTTIERIKGFADSVVLTKTSAFPVNLMFVTHRTDVVQKMLQHGLAVYLETFSNEFVSQAWDFYSDSTVEINAFFQTLNISGVITDVPLTASRYKRNRCLGSKVLKSYMTPPLAGDLYTILPSGPPAIAPNPVLNNTGIVEPPLPSVAPSATPSLSPASSPVGIPRGSGSGQLKVGLYLPLSTLMILYAVLRP